MGSSDGAGGLSLASPAPAAFSKALSYLEGYRFLAKAGLVLKLSTLAKKWTGFYLVLFAVIELLELDASPSVHERARLLSLAGALQKNSCKEDSPIASTAEMPSYMLQWAPQPHRYAHGSAT